MGFENKLRQLCAACDRTATRNLASHTKDLARLVAAALKSGRWEDLPIKTADTLALSAEMAVEAAQRGDAAEFIHEKLLGAENGKIVDLKMRVDLRVVQEQIYALFESKDAPERGFVYVAWSARPERFMYVGKAASIQRLNLATHGKLANATAHVTTLSLLFPTQSTERNLLDLEASVIELVRSSTGALPELNTKRETVPTGTLSERLGHLASFFEERASQIDPFEA